MRNLKIGTKLALGFGTVIFLMVEIAAVVIATSIEYGNNLDRIEKVCEMQMLSNHLLDTFNDARIEARSMYHTIDGDSNDAYYSHQSELEELYRELVAYIEESRLFLPFLDDLSVTRELYLDWKLSLEDVIAGNYALSETRDLIYETGDLLGNIGGQLADVQIEQIASGEILAEDRPQDTLQFRSARVQQANRINDNIYAFRLDVRALLDNYDTLGLSDTLAYIDNAILQLEQYREESVSTRDRDAAQHMIDAAMDYRANVVEFGTVCDNAALSVSKAIPLGEETADLLSAVMSTLN